MSGLDNLKTRLNYSGGSNQEGRMNIDKLKSLKKALLYSYQAVTAILADGREFRCLINPDKLKKSYDDKIISIPFKDICLGKVEFDIDEYTNEKIMREIPALINGKTSDNEEEIGLKPGDVFTWKENQSDWIVYLQNLEETAYFRAEIRRCRYEVEINKNKYKVYICGPSQSSIVWHTKSSQKGVGVSWNDLNYDVEMYITKNQETEEFCYRFGIIKIEGKPYEIQAVDSLSLEGVIAVALKEYYQNSVEDLIQEKREQEEENKIPEEKDVYIIGDEIVYPYDIKQYEISTEVENGKWEINSSKAKIINQNNKNVTVEITTGKKGNFDLIYTIENEDNIVLHVTIASL